MRKNVNRRRTSSKGLNLKDKKTKLIIGGGVTLALIIAIGVGLGVGLSTSDTPSLGDKGLNPLTAKQSLQNKVEAFLNLGLNEKPEIKEELEKLKNQLNDENANVEEIQKKIETQLTSYLKNQLQIINARLKEFHDNGEIKVFDDVASKDAELDTKQKKLIALININTVGADILEGRTTIAQIGEIVFTPLTRTVTEYKEDLGKYKTALLHLTTMDGVPTDIQTSIQAIHDGLVAGTTMVSSMLSQMETHLMSPITSRLTTLNTLLDSVPVADRDLYTDIKAIIDSENTKKTALETLKTYLETDGNINTLLLSTVADIDTRFSLPSEMTTENTALVEDFVENKETLKTRTARLTAIKAALGQTWITSVTDLLPTKTELITEITTHEAITTYEGLLPKIETLENKIYVEISKYKDISTRLDELKNKIDALEATDTTRPALQELYDYFSNEETILTAISTQAGMTTFNTNVAELERVIPDVDEARITTIKARIVALLALDLTEETLIEADLNNFIPRLEADGADIDAISIEINTKIKQYLTFHLNAIKTQISEIKANEDIKVFDEVSSMLAALEKSQTTLETLNTDTILADLISRKTPIAKIGETTFTPLTTEAVTQYNEKLSKYKAALVYLKTKFEGVSADIQTSIQAIHDGLVAGTTMVSSMLSQMATNLMNPVTSRLTALNTLLDSVPVADRNLYTDIKAIIDSENTKKTTLETIKTYLETDGNINTLLLSTVAEIDTRFSLPSEITTENKALLTDFATNSESLKTRTTLLTSIKTALGETWITSVTDFLPTRTTLIADLTAALSTYEGLAGKVEGLETRIYEEILKYKNLATKRVDLKTIIDSLEATDTTLPALQELYDYFSNKETILTAISTQTGMTTFNTNVAEIERITSESQDIKINAIKAIIDRLLAFNLTEDTTIEAALEAFKARLDADGADVDAISIEVNTKIKEYLTVHLDEIKEKIKEIKDTKDITVFDEVDDLLIELETDKSNLEDLNTDTVLQDMLSNTAIITQIGETAFTPLTKPVTQYTEELEKFKTALEHLSQKFFDRFASTQAALRTNLGYLTATNKVVKVSTILNNVKTQLLSYVNTIIDIPKDLIDSVLEGDRNTYTDIKAIIDKAIEERTTLQAIIDRLETEGGINNLLLSSVADIDLNFNTESTITEENKALIADYVSNLETTKAKKALLDKIVVAFGRTWITNIADFLPTRETLIRDTSAQITTYEGLLTKLEAREQTIYDEVLKYGSIASDLKVVKDNIDVLEETDPQYISLKELYDYFINVNTILTALSTEDGVTELFENIEKLKVESKSDSLPLTAEFENSVSQFVEKVQTLSTDTPEGGGRKNALDDGMYKLIQEHQLFCGGTDRESANRELQAFIYAHEGRQFNYLKPHSITSKLHLAKTLTKYRDEEDVEKLCWKVEISDFPSVTSDQPTDAEISRNVRMFANIANAVSNERMRGSRATELLNELLRDSGMFCDANEGNRRTHEQLLASFKRSYSGYDLIESSGRFYDPNSFLTLFIPATQSVIRKLSITCYKVTPSDVDPVDPVDPIMDPEPSTPATDDEFATRVNSFQTEMTTLSTDTPTGDDRNEKLEKGEFDLIQKYGVYCAVDATTITRAQNSFNSFIKKYQDKLFVVLKPQKIVTNSRVLKQFTKYRDQDNVELSCWDVVISDFSKTTPLTKENAYKYATVTSNFYRYYGTAKINEEVKKMAVDRGVYCSMAVSAPFRGIDAYLASIGLEYSVTSAAVYVYGEFFRSSVKVTDNAYCYRVAPKKSRPTNIEIDTTQATPTKHVVTGEFSTRADSFKTKVETLSTDETGDTRDSNINYGIFKAMEEFGIYCTTADTVEDVQTEIDALFSKVLKFSVFVLPDLKAKDEKIDLTFSKFKDETNKVLKCWDVEVKLEPRTGAITNKEVNQRVAIYNNISKAKNADGLLTDDEWRAVMRKFTFDSHLTCYAASSVPSSTNADRFLSEYRLKVKDENEEVTSPNRFYFIQSSGLRELNRDYISYGNCYRVTPHTRKQISKPINMEQTNGIFEVGNLRVKFNQFRLYDTIKPTNTDKDFSISNEIRIDNVSNTSQKYSITFKNTEDDDVDGNGTLYNVIFHFERKADGTIIIVIDNAFYKTEQNTKKNPKDNPILSRPAFLPTTVAATSMKLSLSFFTDGTISTEDAPEVRITEALEQSFTTLSEKFEGISEETQTSITKIRDDLDNGIITLAEAKEQINTLITSFINPKIQEYDDLLALVSEDAKDRYSDLKTEAALATQNRAGLIALRDYITANGETLLDDSTVINTQFTNFQTFAATNIRRSAIDYYASNKDKLATDLALLKKIETGMEENGFNAAIFDSLSVRAETLADIKAKFAIVDAKNQIMDEIVRNTKILLDGLHANLMKYKDLGTKIAELTIIVAGLETTDSTYLALKALLDYFSNRETLLEAISTADGVNTLETNILELNTATALEARANAFVDYLELPANKWVMSPATTQPPLSSTIYPQMLKTGIYCFWGNEKENIYKNADNAGKGDELLDPTTLEIKLNDWRGYGGHIIITRGEGANQASYICTKVKKVSTIYD